MNINVLFRVLSTIDPNILELPVEEPDEREQAGFEPIKRDVFFVDSLYAGRFWIEKVSSHPLYHEGCDMDLMRQIVQSLLNDEKNLSLFRWAVSCIRKGNFARIYVALIYGQK